MDILSFYLNFKLILSAEAYLDPGSGSVLIQLLIAGLVGAGFILKASWSKIKVFFKRSKGTEEDKPDDDQ